MRTYLVASLMTVACGQPSRTGQPDAGTHALDAVPDSAADASPDAQPIENGTCQSPTTIPLTLAGGIYTAMVNGTTAGAASSVPAAACDFNESSGAGPDQVWKLVNPVTQPLVISFDSTMFDGVLRLTSTACDLATQPPDDPILSARNAAVAKSDGCADLYGSSETEHLNFNRLPAGTYYLIVDGYRTTDLGAYTLAIRAGGGTCVNGTVEANEQCDDGNSIAGDGCSPSCVDDPGFGCAGNPSACHPIACGDGFTDLGEECDDHNTISGDGCSNNCEVETGYGCTGSPSVCAPLCGNGTWEWMNHEDCDAGGTSSVYCDASCHFLYDTLEVEPNSTGTSAQVITATNQVIRGRCDMDDLDVFTFQLTSPATVGIETFTTYEQNHTGTGSNPHFSCASQGIFGADTEVSLFTDAASVMLTDATGASYDNDSGEGGCAFLTTAVLAPGTYWFTVHDNDDDGFVFPVGYMIDFTVD